MKWNADSNERTQLLNKVSIAFETILLADVGTPLTKFEYPSGKRRTAATIQQMRNAEDALDSFWRFVDEHCRDTVGLRLHELLADVLTPRGLKRTPEVDRTLYHYNVADFNKCDRRQILDTRSGTIHSTYHRSGNSCTNQDKN